MSPDEIYVALRKQVLATLPEVAAEEVTPEANMESLGANSLDRLDIVTATLEDVAINAAPAKLAGARNLRELVQIMYEQCG